MITINDLLPRILNLLITDINLLICIDSYVYLSQANGQPSFALGTTWYDIIILFIISNNFNIVFTMIKGTNYTSL